MIKFNVKYIFGFFFIFVILFKLFILDLMFLDFIIVISNNYYDL